MIYSKDGYIKINNTESLNTTEFSVFLRFIPKDWRHWRYLTAKGVGTPFSDGWTGWRVNNGLNDCINFDIMDQNSGKYIRISYYTDLTIRTVRDLVCVYDGKTIKIYGDGELRASRAFEVDDFSNTYPIYVGSTSQPDGSYCAEYYDYGFWKRALTDEEVFNLTHYHIIPDNPEFYFKFYSTMSRVYHDLTGKYTALQAYNRQVVKKNRGISFDVSGYSYGALPDTLSYINTTFIAVGRVKTVIKGGISASGRNCLIRCGGDKLMVWDEVNGYFQTSQYDGTWHPVSGSRPEPDKYFTVASIANKNELHLYVAGDGYIYMHRMRDDIDASSVTPTSNPWTNLGGAPFGYNLEGEIVAAMIYERVLSEDEIRYISNYGWRDPPRDGLKFWVNYEKFKEGDSANDLVNNLPPHKILDKGLSPRPLIKKPLR